MIQRKCGTCKYFEESGIASSGWCRHPERQELEHMVLVRPTELACRDGWDHDLWEPKDSQKIASNQRSAGTIRQTDDGKPISPESEPARILATHDRIRVDGYEPTHEAPVARRSEPGMPVPRRINTGAAPDVRDQLEEPGPSRSGQFYDLPTQVDELRSESVSIRAVRSEVPSPPGSIGPAGWTDYPTDTRPHRHEPATQSGVNGAEESAVVPSPPVQQSGTTEPFTFEDQLDAPAPESADAGYPVTNGTDPDLEHDLQDAQDSTEIPLLPMVGNQKPCCRNCRDFIPQDGGRQGWCSNPFAFDTRQLVDGDSIACQSTLGSWWSPSDDWWMERADIAHHSAPTPLVDNLIRELRNRLLGVEGSTEERERS